MAESIPLMARKKILGGAEETTRGTYYTAGVTAALAATRLYDIKATPQNWFGDGKIQPQGNYQGNRTAVVGKQIGKLAFRQELRWGDKFGPLLTGCGYKLTTGGVYVPTSDQSLHKTWSFAVWEDGRVKKLRGCSGTCKLEGTNGGRVFAAWDWTGVWEPVTDEAMPADPTVSQAPYLCSSLTLSLGTGLPRATEFGIDLGAGIEEVGDLTAGGGGVAYFHIAEREPMLTLNPLARKVADYDSWGLFLAGTEAALSLVLTSGAKTLTIAAPAVQRVNVGDEEVAKKLADKLECQINNTGDNDLTFTASA